MSVDMPDFKLSFRGQRKRADERGAQGQIDRMAEEIRTLDEAAQRASRGIGESAADLRSGNRRAQGSDEDLLGELADAVAGRTEAIRGELGQLSALLDRARQLVGEDSPSEDAEPAAPTEADWQVTPAALDGVPAPALNGSHQSRPATDLRLAATQMAISGSTRAEIELHLRGALEPGEVDTLLDEIFGRPEAGASR